MQRFHLNPLYADTLARAGLDSYAALADSAEPGEVIAQEEGRGTWRLVLEGQAFYLKRVHKPRPKKALEALLQMEIPHHYCWREMQQTRYLQAAGIAVMEVAAAGEATRWGIPVSSFILVREVPGQALDQVFETSSAEDKLALMNRLGLYTGKLHISGFFTPARMKDIFLNDDKQFVLIDREARNPRPSRFTPKRAGTALYKTSYRQARDGVLWSEEEWAAYSRGYREAVASNWPVADDELRTLWQR
jgi:tRNA A-37 threonylcarbamoyl transferase component Bud32